MYINIYMLPPSFFIMCIDMKLDIAVERISVRESENHFLVKKKNFSSRMKKKL
jgi:hypothetical protein